MLDISRPFKIALSLGALVALGACDSGEAPAAPAAAPTNETVAIQQGNDFPAGFDGRWGVLDSDCTSSVRGASEMFVAISGDTLKFFDRTGTVTKMTVKSPEKVSTRIDFTGRGIKWFRLTNWYLEDGDKTLIRADTNPVLNMTYSRCE